MTVVNDSRFFVCKFEQRPVAQTTVTEGDEKSSEAQVPPTKVPKVEEKDDELELNGKEVEVVSFVSEFVVYLFIFIFTF